MAFRPLILFVGLLLLALVSLPAAQACFGPKLFVGAGQGPQGELLYALVTLYVQEKTGVESNRVEMAESETPAGLLANDKVDLIFLAGDDSPFDVVFQVADMPFLASGPRPLQELQFTTVVPAIRKLNGLLEGVDVHSLIRQVESGESALIVARKFLMKNRWI